MQIVAGVNLSPDVPPFRIVTVAPEGGRWSPDGCGPENDLVCEMIRRDGYWEPFGAQLFIGALRAAEARGFGGVVVDVGAHVGWYTLLAANMKRRVVAIEPEKAYADALEASLLLDPDAARLVTLRRQRFGGTSPATIDDLLSESPDAAGVALVKADVEGFEPYVIQGARRTLAANRAFCLLVEVTPRSGDMDEWEDMCRTVMDFGYDAYDVGICPQQGECRWAKRDGRPDAESRLASPRLSCDLERNLEERCARIAPDALRRRLEQIARDGIGQTNFFFLSRRAGRHYE